MRDHSHHIRYSGAHKTCKRGKRHTNTKHVLRTHGSVCLGYMYTGLEHETRIVH